MVIDTVLATDAAWRHTGPLCSRVAAVQLRPSVRAPKAGKKVEEFSLRRRNESDMYCYERVDVHGMRLSSVLHRSPSLRAK